MMNEVTKLPPVIEVKKLGTCFNGEWIHQDLNMTMMLQPRSAGEIYLMNEKISSYDLEDAYTKKVLSQMSMMFQQGALYNSNTILENVMFPILEYTTFSYDTVREIAYQKLRLTGLKEIAYNKYPMEISPGMQKRLEHWL
jgi:phospholipid/cholesterol/gamma-HCH transport system ATP-binding protein